MPGVLKSHDHIGSTQVRQHFSRAFTRALENMFNAKVPRSSPPVYSRLAPLLRPLCSSGYVSNTAEDSG